LGEYRAEFQKLVIIANPSLMKEMKVQSDQPTAPIVNKQSYTPLDAPIIVNNQEIKELGDSKKQILGDIPKTVDTNTLEVLKELITVQQDVIAQQRKVIEQQDETIIDSVREYQSLLSLVTKEKEIEDVRQQIFKKPDQANFIEIDSDGERLSGKATVQKGNGNYILNPTNDSNIAINIVESNDGLRFDFTDNAAFLNSESYAKVKESLLNRLDTYKINGVSIESRVSSYALSGAESQRIAVERMLVYRSILIELGLSPSLIKLKTVSKAVEQSSEGEKRNVEEDNYGWIMVKKNA
jgi:vacuolar-type H+-ATPase subunit H